MIKQYDHTLLSKSTAKKMYQDVESSSFWDVNLAQAKTCKWAAGAKIRMLIDSGANRTCIPVNMLPPDFLRSLQTVGEEESTLANGSTEVSPVVLIDLRLETLNGDPLILQDVPVNLLEEGDEALLGSDIMRLIDHRNVNGLIAFLKPDSLYYDLDDAEFESQVLKVQSRTSNVDPSTNEAKPPEPLHPPNIGMEVSPLKDAFGKPAKPQPPKRSR